MRRNSGVIISRRKLQSVAIAVIRTALPTIQEMVRVAGKPWQGERSAECKSKWSGRGWSLLFSLDLDEPVVIVTPKRGYEARVNAASYMQDRSKLTRVIRFVYVSLVLWHSTNKPFLPTPTR